MSDEMVDDAWRGKPMSRWSNRDCVAWAKSEKLHDETVSAFAREHVDGVGLLTLDTKDKAVAELGIQQKAGRKLAKLVRNYAKPPDEGPDTFTLNIQLTNKKTVQLPDIAAHFTIGQVKELLYRREPVDKLVLRSPTKTCDDKDTLESHGISCFSPSLYQVKRQRGGASEVVHVICRSGDVVLLEDYVLPAVTIGRIACAIAKMQNMRVTQVYRRGFRHEHLRAEDAVWQLVDSSERCLELTAVLEAPTKAVEDQSRDGTAPDGEPEQDGGADAEAQAKAKAEQEANAAAEREEQEAAERAAQAKAKAEAAHRAWRRSLREGDCLDYFVGGRWCCAVVDKVVKKRAKPATLTLWIIGSDRRRGDRESVPRSSSGLARLHTHTRKSLSSVSKLEEKELLAWISTFPRKSKKECGGVLTGAVKRGRVAQKSDLEWTLLMPRQQQPWFCGEVRSLQRDARYYVSKAIRLKEEQERKALQQVMDEFSLCEVVSPGAPRLENIKTYSSFFADGVRDRVCGLRNLGMTCFFNSAVQVLLQTPRFVEYCLTLNQQVERHMAEAIARKQEEASSSWLQWLASLPFGGKKQVAPLAEPTTVTEAMLQLIRDVHEPDETPSCDKLKARGRRPDSSILHRQLVRVEPEFGEMKQDDAFLALEVLLKAMDGELQVFAGSSQRTVSEVVPDGELEEDERMAHRLFERHLEENHSIIASLLHGVEAVGYHCLNTECGCERRVYQTFGPVQVGLDAANARLSVVLPTLGKGGAVLNLWVQPSTTLGDLKKHLALEIEDNLNKSWSPDSILLLGVQSASRSLRHTPLLRLLRDEEAPARGLADLSLLLAVKRPDTDGVVNFCLRFVINRESATRFGRGAVLEPMPVPWSHGEDVGHDEVLDMVRDSFGARQRLSQQRLALTVMYNGLLLSRGQRDSTVRIEKDAMVLAVWAPHAEVEEEKPEQADDMISDAIGFLLGRGGHVFTTPSEQIAELDKHLAELGKLARQVARAWRQLGRRPRMSRTERALRCWRGALDTVVRQSARVEARCRDGLEAFKARLQRETGESLHRFQGERELSRLVECLAQRELPVTFAQKQQAYRCPECAECEVYTRHRTVVKGPEVLVLRLERFARGGSATGTSKVTRAVHFERHLVFGQSDYDLFGVCCHHGSTSAGGHYIAYVRSIATGQWYVTSDMRCSRVDARQALDASGASVLLYSRRGRVAFPSPQAHD